MFGFLKKLFGGSGNDDAVKNAIRGGALLVDVRSPAEFAAGTVPGAVNIPLGQVANNVSKFRNKNGVVVFCRSGSRSAMAKKILEGKEIEGVVNGGAWQSVKRLKEER